MVLGGIAGVIDRGELKLALPLYLSLQEEQSRILDTFDKFDSSGDGRLTARDLALLMTDLNDGNKPSKAEVDYVLSQADKSGDGAIGRDEVMTAVSVWYPIVHANREVTIPPKCSHDAASEHRVAMSRRCEELRAHCEAIFKTFDESQSGIIGSRELSKMMNAIDEEMGSGDESPDAIQFVLTAANIAHPECMHQTRIVPALANYLAMRDEVQLIDAKFNEYDAENSGTLTPAEVAQVLQMLNDGIAPSTSEIDWVLKIADSDGNGELNHTELRKAVMIWYTHVENRRAIETDLQKATAERVGLLRRAVAAQMKVHEVWVERALKEVRMQMDGTISRQQVAMLMSQLLQHDDDDRDVVQAVPETEVDFVITLAEHSGGHGHFGDGAVLKSELIVPLAMWRGLQHELQMIDAKFEQMDTLDQKRPGLTRRELRSLLTELNDGIRPTRAELDWVFATGRGSNTQHGNTHGQKSSNKHHISSAEGNASLGQETQLLNILGPAGQQQQQQHNQQQQQQHHHHHHHHHQHHHDSGSIKSPSAATTVETRNAVLNRLQTRAAVTLWFLHIQTLPIAPKTGWRMMIPFVYVFVTAVLSVWIVAATTILFSEEKTIEWLEAVFMTQLWRNFIIDPLKALMFGRTLEMIFGLLLGGCAFEEAALGVVQGELESAAEGESVDFASSIDVDDVDVDNMLIQTDMADTPDTPNDTATLVGPDEEENNDDSAADDDGNDDNQHPNGDADTGRAVLGGGVSAVVGSQTADTVLRSHANYDALHQSQTQREDHERKPEQTEEHGPVPAVRP